MATLKRNYMNLLLTKKNLILLLSFLLTFSIAAFSQSVQSTKVENKADIKTYTYAYIRVQGKAFSKKLKVDVDFGDTPEQLKAGEEYSEISTNKKSYAAVLNYMADKKFELVQTLEQTSSFNGSGGTSGVVFIMKREKE